MQKNLKKRDRSRVTKREKELFFLKVDFCDIFILCLPKKAKNYFQKKTMFACVCEWTTQYPSRSKRKGMPMYRHRQY